MSSIGQPYTLGVWTVKPGSEEAFITEWETFARWTARNHPGAGTACLLRDTDHPEQFISFGPWESVEVIKSWRERSEFKAFVVKARQLCTDFQPHSMTAVASSTE